jgi:hypothetical protein
MVCVGWALRLIFIMLCANTVRLARLTRRNLASANLLRNIIPKLPSVFPSTQAQANAFGPGIYMLGGAGQNAASEIGSRDEKEGMQMDLKDGEVWGLIASFGLQAPPDEQTALVSSLRDKVCFPIGGTTIRGRF